MKTAIYALNYRGENVREQPKAFIQLRPAKQAYNREVKRLFAGEVSWHEVRLMKWEAVGTPRSVESAMVEIGSAISGGVPTRQMNYGSPISLATVDTTIISRQSV